MQEPSQQSGWGRRAAHESQLLTHLRRHGAADRATLAKALGLSRATVSTLTRDLLGNGAVTISTAAPVLGRTGRRPEMLTLNPAAGMLAGVDLGHAHVSVAAANAAHVVAGTRTVRCEPETDWAGRTQLAVAMVRGLITDNSVRLLGVGIGLAGAIAHRDVVAAEVHRAFRRSFATPVIVDNNTRLAGLAEHIWGAARGADDVLYVRLAAGVGGAVVLDGEMRLGPRNLAGEIGHVVVTDEPLPCRCGKTGCLESIAGRQELLDAAGTANLESLISALRSEDPRATSAVRRAAAAIARALASVCTAVDIHDVVLAGELLVLGEHLLDPLRSAFERHTATTARPGASSLHLAHLGQSAGALGGIGALLRAPEVTLPLTAHDPVAS